MVESGKRDPVSGAVYPWPWTINAEGIGHWYESKAEAIAAVQALQARGVRSIDVGCMQVNLSFHPEAFASLDMAFDPMTNAAYGARFLQQLFNQTNAWPLAAAAYHSFTPDVGADYATKVLGGLGGAGATGRQPDGHSREASPCVGTDVTFGQRRVTARPGGSDAADRQRGHPGSIDDPACSHGRRRSDQCHLPRSPAHHDRARA